MAGTSVTTGAPPTDLGGSSARAPKEFFSLQSIGTLAGASSGLYVIVGALSQATSWSYPRWFPLVVAFALVTLIDLAVTQGWSGGTVRQLPARILVLTLNGCLVFTSALGGAVAFRGYNEPEPTTTVANPTPTTTPPPAPTPAPVGEAPASPGAPTAPTPVAPPEPTHAVAEPARPTTHEPRPTHAARPPRTAEPAHPAGSSPASGEATAGPPSHPSPSPSGPEVSRPSEPARPRPATKPLPNLRRPSGFGRMIDAFRD